MQIILNYISIVSS